ncbi:hypothetical protein AMATHDRAFT_134158 [Amanita thiersii Skay4041]|uniref:Major facilitator superfamily (MFS) profile domain-containing protein n=1 Tax=Amanita thiersii Skay4041 TaxID=703135 RepID=A0A2A9NYT1_9AGAR|nr:hypothetical protein AMATHDRAFT_134158 [Amanita thiersii Skay4041]
MEVLEKTPPLISQVTTFASEAVTNSQYRPDIDTSHVDERKLLRRIDLHLLPWLSVLYLLSFLDRGSIGNAKLYSLEQDISVTDNQYLIGLTVFFFPYAIFEPASNVVLRSIKPSTWLSGMMFCWGIVMTFHGFIRNYAGLLVLRILLGIAEAGLYPGVVFYLSSWYRRSELGFRVAIFFSAATVAGAFSGLLAAAIANMDGIGGKPGWAWIFILEGLATTVAAFISFWVVQDFPETAKFLTEEERVFVIRQLHNDMQFSAGGEPFKTRYLWDSLSDWKTWVASEHAMNRSDGPLYAFSLFTPSIINQLGFEATEANLLSVPVYVWGCLVTCFIGFLGDRIGSRSWINLKQWIGLVAYIILVVSRTPALSYFAVYLAVRSVGNPASAWVSSNTEGAYKRSVTLGMAVGFGNINGAVATNIYRADDRPWYRLGHGVVLAYIAIGFFFSAFFSVLLRRENARRERGDRDEVVEGVDNKRANERNGIYKNIEEARRAKGDKWSGFRYTC